MEYINKKTGIVINVESTIEGGDWEPKKERKPAREAKKIPQVVVDSEKEE